MVLGTLGPSGAGSDGAGDDADPLGDGRAAAGNRGRRGGAYWVAYRTAAGRQHKVYLGKAEELTPERLALAAAALAGRVAPAAELVGDTPTAPARPAGRTGEGAVGLPLLATKAALFGLLARLRDLGATLLLVEVV